MSGVGFINGSVPGHEVGYSTKEVIVRATSSERYIPTQMKTQDRNVERSTVAHGESIRLSDPYRTNASLADIANESV